jgi:hypothetical protein
MPVGTFNVVAYLYCTYGCRVPPVGDATWNHLKELLACRLVHFHPSFGRCVPTVHVREYRDDDNIFVFYVYHETSVFVFKVDEYDEVDLLLIRKCHKAHVLTA